MGAKEVDVHGGSATHARPRAGHGVGKERRLRDALAGAAVGLGHGNAEPAPVRHRLHKGLREFPLLVAATPIVVAEVRAEFRRGIRKGLLFCREFEVHGRFLAQHQASTHLPRGVRSIN